VDDGAFIMVIARRRTATIAVGAVVLVAALAAGIGWGLISSASGDPGGKVLAQLVPVVSAIPSGTSMTYLWKLEPTQDSCDGIAGTQGWSQVVVQTAFRWRKSPQALFVVINERLLRIDWGHGASQNSSPPGYQWTKKLSNGTRADLTIDKEPSSTLWQLDAVAPPVGKAASGC
jgi:hypothetical protein